MSKKKVILVIDDSKVCQGFIKLLFDTSPDYEIVSAYTGLEAIEKVTIYNNITLILLDLALPDIPGNEIYKIFQTHEKLKRIPIIFQSGHNFDKTKLEINNHSNVSFISKPFSAEELINKIENFIGVDSPDLVS